MLHLRFVLLLLVIATPAHAHDWYTGLRDARGRSCCADRDCHAVGLCILPTRNQGLVIEGACRSIPKGKVLGTVSPDGNAHACWDHVAGRPQVRCVILPGDV